MVMADSPALRGCLSRRHAGRRDPSAGLDDAARRRGRRAAAGLPGPVPGGQPMSSPPRRSRPPRRRPNWPVYWQTSRLLPVPGQFTSSTTLAACGARRVGLRHHRGLPGVLALHLGHHRDAEGRDAPARVGPGGLRDLRRPGARHHAGRTAACRRPRRSSPTASATRCCSRSRSARPAVLLPAPSRPDLIAETAVKYGATLFFGGPTFFANMLRAGLPGRRAGRGPAGGLGRRGAARRRCTQRWTAQFGIDILDGIGMTEMLHIFLSNRARRGAPGHHRRRGARLRPQAGRRGHRPPR